MAYPKLFVLGAPRMEHDGQPIQLNLRKALALLVYLAVSGQPTAAMRSRLCSGLTVTSAKGAPGCAAPSIASRRRSATQILDSSPETIRLNRTADLWLDCAAFRQHATAGLAAAHDVVRQSVLRT